MKVIVSGSGGFIGSKLVDVLKEDHHEVIEFDISEGIDILKWDTIKDTLAFDVFVHLAANSFVPASYEKPREFYHLNLLGVINALELCRLCNAKFIFSSSYVYGKPYQLPIPENHPLQGFNPYAETKILGEKICENYYKYFNVRSLILRPFNIYGKGQNENFLIPLILKQAKTGRINLLDSRPKRDYVYIDDVVNAFRIAVNNETAVFEKFNIGFGRSYSVKEIVDIVNSFYNNQLEISFQNLSRKNEILDTVADITKARTILNWIPKTDIFNGLKIIFNL